MRRLAVPRTVTAGALGAIITLLALVILPGIGIGDPTTSHGGSPSDVFMSTEPAVCSGEDPVETEPASLLPTAVHVGGQSHVLVYFGSMTSWFQEDSVLVLRLQILDGNGFFESSDDFTNSPGLVHTSGTVMWTFEDIGPGDYTVQATAQVFPNWGAPHPVSRGANLQSCALTAFVIPVA